MKLAAILATADAERLYTGLSLCVSAASHGDEVGVLVSFPALAPLMAKKVGATPSLTAAGRERFTRSFDELRSMAFSLPNLSIWACSATVECTGVEAELVERRLDGVLSMPRFLERAEGARLVVV